MPCMNPINLVMPDAIQGKNKLAALSNPLYNSLTIPRSGLLIEEADGSCSLGFGIWAEDNPAVGRDEMILGSAFF